MAKLYFTKKANIAMEKWGLTTADVRDVFFSGQYFKHPKYKKIMVKHYPSRQQEITVQYFRGSYGDVYVITNAWVRKRR